MDHLTSLSEQLKNLDEKVDLVLKLVSGNGSPEKGLIVRMDRAERSLTWHVWFFRTLAGAVITACVYALVKLTKGG